MNLFLLCNIVTSTLERTMFLDVQRKEFDLSEKSKLKKLVSSAFAFAGHVVKTDRTSSQRTGTNSIATSQSLEIKHN